MERPFFAVPHLSTVFFAVPALFSPVLDDFRQKREKKVVKKWRNGKGKKRVLSSFFPVPVFSRSFPRTSLVGTWQLPTSGAHIFLTPPSFSMLFGAADAS